jgi:hypothetical protein
MRSGCRAIVSAALLTLACIPAEVGAQPLVGATVGVSNQGAGASDAPYLGPPFGGTSLTSIVMVDVPVGEKVSVGGEASLAASISGTQNQRVGSFTNAQFVSRHHDSVISATIKAGMPFAGRVRAAAVGGFGAARRYTSRTGIVAESFSSTPGSSPYSASLTTWVPAATGGGDAAVHVAERVAIVTTGRVHFLLDNDRREDGVVRRGISSLIVRIGAGVQIGF